MREYKVLEVKMYDEVVEALSAFSGEPVEIIGEQRASVEGVEIEQYLYNIVGYTPENGKPFAALKSNLIIL